MKFTSILATIVSISSLPSFAQVIQFHPEAAISGGDCKINEDIFITTTGNDISVVALGNKLNLDMQGPGPLGATKNCALRIPTVMTNGYYVKTLNQRLAVEVIKSVGAAGSISMRGTILNFPVPFATAALPYGQVRDETNGPVVAERVDRFTMSRTPSWVKGYCSFTKPTRGFLALQLSILGQRQDSSEYLLTYVEGRIFKFDGRLQMARCPQ